MRRHNQMVPRFEALEVRDLPSGPGFLSFAEDKVIRDPSSRDTYYMVAGFQARILIDVPTGYLGISRVDMSIPNMSEVDESTLYRGWTITDRTATASPVDDYHVAKTWTDAEGRPTLTRQQVPYLFREGYTPGTYEIVCTIQAQRWAINAAGDAYLQMDTLTDTLTIINESPEVQSFTISGLDSPPTFGGDGASLEFRSGDLRIESTVTNTTHYSLALSYIQLVAGYWDVTYQDGSYFHIQTPGNVVDTGFAGPDLELSPGETGGFSASYNLDFSAAVSYAGQNINTIQFDNLFTTVLSIQAYSSGGSWWNSPSALAAQYWGAEGEARLFRPEAPADPGSYRVLSDLGPAYWWIDPGWLDWDDSLQHVIEGKKV